METAQLAFYWWNYGKICAQQVRICPSISRAEQKQLLGYQCIHILGYFGHPRSAAQGDLSDTVFR